MFLENFAPIQHDYVFAIGLAAPEFVMSNVQSPNLSFNLKDSCEVSFKLNQNDPIAKEITELLTDLWVFRDSELFFRGRIGASQDQLDADGGYANFTAYDYRALLGRRHVYDEDQYFWFDEDVAVIAANMLDAIQARPYGNLGITPGTGFPALGVVRQQVEISPGTSIAEALKSLEQSKLRGFDWEVSADLQINMWLKRGTHPTAKPLEYAGGISSMTRDYQADGFANVVRASGGGIPAPQIVTSDTLPTDPLGRWEKEVSWPDVETQEIMNDRVEYLLEQENIVPEEYSVEMMPGRWNGPSDFWLGDPVVMPLSFGRIDTTMSVRVHSINISLDDSGVEKIGMKLK